MNARITLVGPDAVVTVARFAAPTLPTNLADAADAELTRGGYRRTGPWTIDDGGNLNAPVETDPQVCPACLTGCLHMPDEPGCEHFDCRGSGATESCRSVPLLRHIFSSI